MREEELALVLTGAGMATVIAWLAACRVCTWLRGEGGGRRYEPDDLLSSPRAAWPDAEGLQQLSARDTERQLCAASSAHPDDVTGFEMDLAAPHAAPAAASWRWGRAFFGDLRGASDCEQHYACPQQSPGSRHAFAQRLTGPRRASASPSPDKIASPGSVADGARWTSEKMPTRPLVHTARYFGDSAPSASRALRGSGTPVCRQVLGPGDAAGTDGTERSCARQLSMGSGLVDELTRHSDCPEHARRLA